MYNWLSKLMVLDLRSFWYWIVTLMQILCWFLELNCSVIHCDC